MPAILRNHYVLAVHDLRRSADYYVRVLGFRVVAEPPGWIFVRRDGCTVMLGECPDDLDPTALGCHNYFGYLLVDDADAYHREITANGGGPVPAPVDQPWGMREFAVRTVDGHRITIGQEIGG